MGVIGNPVYDSGEKNTSDGGVKLAWDLTVDVEQGDGMHEYDNVTTLGMGSPTMYQLDDESEYA